MELVWLSDKLKKTMMRRLLFCLLVLFIPIRALQAQSSREKDCSLSSLKVCAVHVGQDELGIVTSPLRASAKDLFWIIPFGVATGVAIDYDAHAIRTLGVNPSREDKFKKISDYGGLYGPVAAAGFGYLIGSHTQNDQLRDTAVLAAEAMADATILDQGLKYAINRETPNPGDGTGRFWPHGTRDWPDDASMPSEHAINVWAFAHVVAGQYDGIATKLLVYSLASTVSVSRVIARDHFPSDVLVGSTFGYLVGGYVLHHRSPEMRYFSLSAVNTANGKGVQLSYNFVR